MHELQVDFVELGTIHRTARILVIDASLRQQRPLAWSKDTSYVAEYQLNEVTDHQSC